MIRQPDGTLAWVPCWMLSEEAARHRISPSPCLPLGCLRDLRLELDSLVSLFRHDLVPEKKHDEGHAR